MKKNILFLLVQLIICWQFVYSQTTEFPMKESSLLWKIEGPGIPKGSYLFGTMHLIEKEYFIFPDKLEKIVKKSEQLVMELPGLPNQKEAMKYLLLEEGTFFDFFTPEQVDTILVWAKQELKMNEKAFRTTMSKMKPFVVVQMAAQLHFMGKTESYEMTLEEIAKANNLSIKGLETIEQQMGFFDGLTKAQQTEMVMDGIRETEKSIATLKEMEVLYQDQNVDSLYLMIQDEGGVIADESADFLDNRNAAWVPQIKEMIASKRCFIAVGAGHLGGPNGVIRLLQKEGYTLSAVEL
jgi:uncharacterized protein YbaP (TraB family)